MEKGDTDLRQTNSMVSWKLLRPAEVTGPLRRLFSKKSPTKPEIKTKNSGYYTSYVMIILVLMWPAALSAPLLSEASIGSHTLNHSFTKVTRIQTLESRPGRITLVLNKILLHVVTWSTRLSGMPV